MMCNHKNGRPAVHKHSCSKERKGQVMTTEELHDFAVDVLMQEYAETGARVIEYEKKAGNEADFCFVNTGKNAQFRSGKGETSMNVIVACKDGLTTDISGIDTSWLVDEYYRTGAFPRVTMAIWRCLSDDSEDGRRAICGGEFRFRYYSVSVLPDQENGELEHELSPVELAAKYAEAWNQMDAGIVAPYLDKDFHYGSFWVFDEMPCRKEYLDYFEGKLAAIKRGGTQPTVSVCRNHQNGNVALLVVQGDEWNYLELDTEDGRIVSACMTVYDGTYKVFDPDDELYMSHGDHLDCIMLPEKLMSEHLHGMVNKAKSWRCVNKEVTTDDMYEVMTSVSSLVYGENDIRMLFIVAASTVTHENEILAAYPLGKGVPVNVHIDKVIEWDNQVEATVLCSVGEFSFAFFPVDYYCNKRLYRVGRTVYVDLAALGVRVEEAQRKFMFEGQQAIDWLAKIGKEPKCDENGDVEPVKFNMDNMVAFFNMNSKCPDEAEFQSPAGDIEKTSFLDVDFLKTDVIISRSDTDDGELSLSLPLYFRQEFFSEVKKGDPIRGWLWITGSVTGKHEEHFEKERPLGDMAADFDAFMYESDFKSFDNLMFVMAELPLLKIRDGYELDAFQRGNDHGWYMQAYCCKAGADVRYVPEKHGDYDDSLRIHGRIGFGAISSLPAVLSYMEVPFTEEGIMQAWLLDNLTDFMPKGWHANYSTKYFIFDEYRIDELFPIASDEDGLQGRSMVRNQVKALDRELLLPSVTIDGDTAVLEYAYWNDWSGMTKVCVPVKRVGNSVEFGDAEKELVVKYHCGIRF